MQFNKADVCVVENKHKAVCPVCTKEFPDDEITVHASLCGESDLSDSFECTVASAENDSSPSMPAQTAAFKPKSTEDVLCFIEQQVDTSTEFKLCVDREDLPDRGILQWKRKKAASPASALKVVYIGEAGIDTGALRKEFLTDMVSGIEKRFFEGAGNQSKNPKDSLTDVDNENFRTVGEIMAVSLAQGGPPPAFLREWCYNFLCTGEVDLNSLSQEDVTDLESCLLISRVENSADAESLMLLADEIVSCGYTRQIKLDSKENIIRAIVLHSTTRLIPMLQQLRKDMELYGLVNQMATNPDACHPLFVPGKIIKPDANFIMMNCQSQFSEKGTSKERTERKIINFLQDFLQEIEMSGGETDSAAGDTGPLGQSHIPVLPDEKRCFKITCNFNHECREQQGDHSVCYPTVTGTC
ncbi:G2/M phase-specific E3 ubiquitin-protein ligase-like isoform X2 [Epinephelus lanceolatus]